MVIPNDIEKIKLDAHQPLKWHEYNSTNVRDNTNCFSHAIGITVPLLKYYRLGVLSGKKNVKEEYKSIEEVRDLFLADMSVLDLKIEEILYADTSKFSLLKSIQNIELHSNQHIVVLFVSVLEGKESGRIKDFHFIRYDKEKGWSEKWRGRNVYFFEDISIEWPSGWNNIMVGVFKVTNG